MSYHIQVLQPVTANSRRLQNSFTSPLPSSPPHPPSVPATHPLLSVCIPPLQEFYKITVNKYGKQSFSKSPIVHLQSNCPNLRGNKSSTISNHRSFRSFITSSKEQTGSCSTICRDYFFGSFLTFDFAQLTSLPTFSECLKKSLVHQKCS